MDWSEKDSCIKCNEGRNLLVCSENGCPLAVHEGCMGCPARFDDAGRFYCPYCLYKQAVGEARRAREYALATKKALLLFLDDKTIGSEQLIEENKRAEDDGRSKSKLSEANVKIITCNDGKSKSRSAVILDQPIRLDEEQKISNAEEEKIPEEESEASAGSKGQDPSLEVHEEQRISKEEEKKNQEEEHENQEEGQENNENHEEEHETSAASSGEDSSSHKKHECKISDNEDEKIQEDEGEPISNSTGEDPSLTLHARAKRGSKRRKPADLDSDAVSVPRKTRKQLNKNKQTSPIVDSPRRSSRRSSSTLKTEKVSNEVVGASRSSKKSKLPPVKLGSDAFASGKRKRLLWREEEEELLKAGVEKYSKEGNKIPWRKILDLGMGKFDPTRTPGDLKDKWRNMLGK